jgi:hypothetical protein
MNRFRSVVISCPQKPLDNPRVVAINRFHVIEYIMVIVVDALGGKLEWILR